MDDAEEDVRRARVVALLSLVAAGAVWGSASAFVPTDTREIVLTVEHSRFSASEINVSRGQRVRFVVRNLDPIDHELIVGSMEVQDRHELGTEPHHGARDGEVTVPLLTTRSTEYTFDGSGDGSGTLYFGCHLPGHWDYGMSGTIVVG